jgi:hypothetical protein
MATEYTFFYCLFHDDGCCAPKGVAINPCCVSDHSVCNLVEMGTLSFDGREIRVINPVTMNYNRYGGGFYFKYYASQVLDLNGNSLTNHPVIDWIRAQASQRTIAH